VDNGHVKKVDEMVQLLKDLFETSKPNNFSSKSCVISVPDSQTFTCILNFPQHISKKELKNEVQKEAEKIIPFSFSDLYFDFRIIQKSRNGFEILFVASKREIIDTIIDIFSKAGLKILAIDFESDCLARSLISDHIANGGIFLIDIGAKTTTISIFDQNGIRMTENINQGGNYFDQQIAKKLNVDLMEASRLKKELGFSADRKEGKIMFILQAAFLGILEAVNKMNEYYKNNHGYYVKNGILAGGSSLIPGIYEYFNDNLNVAIKIVDPFKNIDIDDLHELSYDSIIYSIALGLALRGLNNKFLLEGINLIKNNKNQ